jgi:hypothetical protein
MQHLYCRSHAFLFFFGHNSPTRARLTHSWSKFLDHIQWHWHTTPSRTPMDEGPARRRYLWQRTTLPRDRHKCPGGTRTRNPSKPSAVEPNLKPLGHRDRRLRILERWIPRPFLAVAFSQRQPNLVTIWKVSVLPYWVHCTQNLSHDASDSQQLSFIFLNTQKRTPSECLYTPFLLHLHT